MKTASMILTRNSETVKTVAAHMRRHPHIKSFAGGLDDLVAKAAALNLHRQDVAPDLVKAALAMAVGRGRD